MLSSLQAFSLQKCSLESRNRSARMGLLTISLLNLNSIAPVWSLCLLSSVITRVRGWPAALSVVWGVSPNAWAEPKIISTSEQSLDAAQRSFSLVAGLPLVAWTYLESSNGCTSLQGGSVRAWKQFEKEWNLLKHPSVCYMNKIVGDLSQVSSQKCH